jgi:hypothetical protein
MPITGWLCPRCNTPVALNHFEKEAACAGVVAPAVAAAVLASDRERHSGEPAVHVTDLLSCPRKVAIAWQESVAVNPHKYCAIERGTAYHSRLAAHASAECHSELMVDGVIDGMRVIGTADVVWPQWHLVEDYKCPSDFKARDAAKKGASPEHAAQVSIYAAFLNAEQTDWSITRGRIWYLFGSTHVAIDVELRSLEDVLGMPVNGSEWTARDLLHATDRLLKTPGAWKDAPLYGETMVFGANTMCDYCAVKDKCWGQAKGAAF